VSKTDLKLSTISAERSRISALFALGVAIFCLLALLDYNPESLHLSPNTDDSPVLGKAGVFTARTLMGWLGISSWFVPWFFFNLSICFYKKTNRNTKIIQNTSVFLCIFSISILANVRDFSLLMSEKESIFNPNVYEHGAGGSVGALLYSGLPFIDTIDPAFKYPGILRIWLGNIGTTLLSLAILFLAGYYHLRWYFNLENSFDLFTSTFVKLLKRKNLSRPKMDLGDEVNSEESELKKIEPGRTKKWSFDWFTSKDDDDLLFGDVSLTKQSSAAREEPVTSKVKKPAKEKTGTNNIEIPEPSPSSKIIVEQDQKAPEESISSKLVDVIKNDVPVEAEIEMDGFKVVRAAKTEKASDLFPERKGDYHFPTLDLLMEPPEEQANEDEDHMIKARNLKETLSQFKIEIELGEVHTGPVITRYDVHPAAGVRVEKIANLDKNLAMALKADSVRILAPVPGKGCVGIEVPNKIPAAVCLKEILQSKAWADAGAEIPIVLGKEASGRALVADLTKMPHLLVAGSTGSGKTVCINAIIASLCYYSSPEDVRFIMVDPKIVEMKVYNDLPHMLIPVVTEPKKVPGALKWLLVEMERRYQIFSKVGVRNIAGFNAKILKDKEEKEKAQLLDAEMTAEERAALSSIQVPRDDDALEIPENKLPYIVCIIDELADLMMVAQADVETGIARLAQLARAAGIHLIIATQRPSVNVITGVIKANLPSRISFRVASYRDSQTILDGKGAEALIGKGDMLFIPPGSSTFVRAQGAFVSDDEINGIVDYLKVNGPPQIIEEVREQIESAGEDDVLGGGDSASDEDPMVRKAIEVIRTTKRASTSNLQRKLSIGYNRAARIMDDLEDRGLIGPDIPGQGREILMDL
jgi:S-DNA-T family DNA segregation ATPase FtsK/SpoIIIE